jgi:rhamnosyltransferase subunit B
VSRIVLTTLGSLGDLYPYLAVALELRKRGHEPILATHQFHRRSVEAESISFYPARPELDDPALVNKVFDPRYGMEFLIRNFLLPSLEQSYADLLVACHGADLLVAHGLSYAAPIVAEKMNLPWVSVVLQPMALPSTYDPPRMASRSALYSLRILRRLLYAMQVRAASRKTRSWIDPINTLRARLGLPPAESNPFVQGNFSPHGTLGWFSPLLAQPQPDWPPHTQVTGFPFYDRKPRGEAALEPGLAAFLREGDPPVVFTLGSAAVMDAGSFYAESVAAVKRLSVRAVFLLGPDPRNRLPEQLPRSVYVTRNYTDYSALLPHAAVAVHHGGIGTTALTLRAGCPVLVVPYPPDAPDNGERLRKLGVGLVLPRSRYNAAGVIPRLTQLMNNRQYRERAETVAKKISSENGTAAACEALEAALRAVPPGNRRDLIPQPDRYA